MELTHIYSYFVILPLVLGVPCEVEVCKDLKWNRRLRLFLFYFIIITKGFRDFFKSLFGVFRPPENYYYDLHGDICHKFFINFLKFPNVDLTQGSL